MCSKWYPSVEGKRSIPFSPDQSVGGRLREHTLAFLLNCFPFTRTKGKILPLQLDQVEISVPTPKPVGGETRGKGGRHCSPLRRDGTGQKPHLPAGQDSTASSPLPSPAGAAQTFAAVRRGERDHFFPPPPRLGEGLTPTLATRTARRWPRRTQAWRQALARHAGSSPAPPPAASEPREAAGSRARRWGRPRPRVSRRPGRRRGRRLRADRGRGAPPGTRWALRPRPAINSARAAAGQARAGQPGTAAAPA